MTFFESFLDELEKTAAFGRPKTKAVFQERQTKRPALKEMWERAKRPAPSGLFGRVGPSDPVERAAWFKRIRQKGFQGMFKSPQRLGMTPVTPPGGSRVKEVVI